MNCRLTNQRGRFASCISGLLLIGASIIAAAPQSFAQSATAANMWGVIPTSASGATSSVTTSETSTANHLSQSAISNYVAAAKAGVVLNPNLSSSLTIQSVGSQTIVSNTVTGNNNTTSFSGTQSASNSGSVSNVATTKFEPR